MELTDYVGPYAALYRASQCRAFFSGRFRIIDKTKRSLLTTL